MRGGAVPACRLLGRPVALTELPVDDVERHVVGEAAVLKYGLPLPAHVDESDAAVEVERPSVVGVGPDLDGVKAERIEALA